MQTLKVLTCPSGLHDGGKGTCVPANTCSNGYYDDGTGACKRPDAQSGLTDISLSAVPNRVLDMVFMIDNSPASMAPKVSKMNAQFPKLIAALKDPIDGTLPDLRIAIIDSDLGTGSAWSYGGCGVKYQPDGTSSLLGDMGHFQMLTSPTACTFNAGAEFLEYKGGAPVNYTGDINSVFACLTSNLGTMGCGYQHQLQAFEFALAAKGVGNEEQQQVFLRGNAYLGLVFITDEDDCSAAPPPNDMMFGDKPEARGEAAGLRCVTRGHMCGGRNLADPPPGYPTVASFTHPFSDCQAWTDTCPNTTDGYANGTDTSVPTACAPLKNVKHLAEEIKALKDDPDRQILVAGIFGWPLDDADMATAEYKIAPIPNPNTADTQYPTVFDYWPVCYDPDHRPSFSTMDPATGFDATAAGWSAAGGLREAAFLEEFGQNGLKFSICQRDFAASMTAIGNALANMFLDQCFDFKLLDTDPNTDGVQPACSVYWRTSQPDPNDATKVVWHDSATSLSQCPAGATNGGVAEDCWRFVNDTGKCPKTGQWLDVLRTGPEVASQKSPAPGTRVHIVCRTCPDSTTAGCGY